MVHLKPSSPLLNLMRFRVEEAKRLLQDTLSRWPTDGFAQVHYGFILKTSDDNNDLTRAVEFLTKGLRSKHEGVLDGRFYFHLGDALVRLGRTQEALQVRFLRSYSQALTLIFVGVR